MDKGLKAANKFMLGAAIAYRVKKMVELPGTKRKTAVMALKKPKESPCFWLRNTHNDCPFGKSLPI